ncbi:MAG: right-handed parallel beta-helix repeat-containing protein, partial [Planctomycetota bacterium]
MKAFQVLCCVMIGVSMVSAGEYHVSVDGSDGNTGSSAQPFRTISQAADLAQPGDVITVHGGTYRERIDPPRGGLSDTKRIVYQAASGEKVIIKGSEVVEGWTKLQNDTWKVTIANDFFGDFNPYSDLINGDWFNPKGREHHTGAVYLEGHWLTEAAQQDDVLKPIGDTPLWFGKVDAANTTIWAQVKGVNPNEAEVEINVRQAVFYPEKPRVNYITVRGFTMMHAATPWAPPTAEQIGLLGTHWSKGWLIEDNDIRYSTCVGITLGKHGDEYDNTSANTAEGYVKTIERAHANGWSKENIGHHVVRNNRISHCEQAGLVGSMGATFCTITDNVIHDIHIRQLFTGAEMAGIKIHAAIDTLIARNHIYRTCRGIWLDWMAQGTRVTRNLLHDNDTSEDLFVEVNHGPFLIDNNIFLSRRSLLDMSQGGAYVHNLFAGQIRLRPELRRETPYHPAHSTKVAG